MFHPWRTLRDLTDWLVVWRQPTSGARAECHWPSRTITIDPLLLQAERRSVLAHELEHVGRGSSPSWATAREEEVVNESAARRLIDLPALGEALAWAHDVSEIADELWVDQPTVLARLRHLAPAERDYLARRLDDPSS